MATQSAAIPFRRDAEGRLEILLVTSRTRRRWILPKGRVKTGAAPHRAAAEEAYEEAGVIGTVAEHPVGTYRQAKTSRWGTVPLQVRAFPLAVDLELDVWPEMHQRERRWVRVSDADAVIEDGAIRNLIAAFRRSYFGPRPPR